MHAHNAAEQRSATLVRRWSRRFMVLLAILAVTAGVPNTARSAPLFVVWRGDYGVVNLSNQNANDFHATLTDGRVVFKSGFTDDAIDGIPWFFPKTFTPAQSRTFDYAPADNIVPVPPLGFMTFSYTALAPPFFNPPLSGSLDTNPNNTYLTANGAKLQTLTLGFTLTSMLTNRLVTLQLVNPGADNLVVTNLQVWQDSGLDIQNGGPLAPSTSNSTLAFSMASLSLSPNGGTFDVPDFLVNIESAPVIVTATVTDTVLNLSHAELIAFQAVPEPGSATLSAIALVVSGIIHRARRHGRRARPGPRSTGAGSKS